MLLAEFLVPVGDPDEMVAIAEVTVTADVITAGHGVERQEVRLPISASFAGGPKADPEVRREMLLQEAARARDDARHSRQEGDFEGARQRLADCAVMLRAHGPADAQLAEEAEDLETMAERFAACEVSEADAKYLFQRSYATSSGKLQAMEMIKRKKERGSRRR